MRTGTLRMLLIGATLVGSFGALLESQVGGMGRKRVPPAGPENRDGPDPSIALSDGQACAVIVSYFSSGLRQRNSFLTGPHNNGRVTGGALTPTGIRFLLGNKEVFLDYKDVSAVHGTEEAITFYVPSQKHGDVTISRTRRKGTGYPGGGYSRFGIGGPDKGSSPTPNDQPLAQAFSKLVTNGRAGYPYDCRTEPMTPTETAKELSDFQQKTAAWRAMDPKPPLSDEVTKRRLLAEDAVQRKDFTAAQDHYRIGVTIDPTWAPGWYNAALISAELQDYSAAANYMKHYLVLLPNAPDAPAAKEKTLLWEAKAEEASRK
jgi:hypothetical protein